jgi:methylmalonyl-CoA/ethylmalonyl-CoA epimerase
MSEQKPGRDAIEQLPLDHVGVAVASLASAIPLYELLTGGRGSASERVDAQGVRVAFVGDGDGRLELIEPVDPASPVARFLQRRGPGLHHVAYRVSDIVSTLHRLEATGIELIDRVPRIGAHGRRIAFLHPRGTGGVLIELVEG